MALVITSGPAEVLESGTTTTFSGKKPPVTPSVRELAAQHPALLGPPCLGKNLIMSCSQSSNPLVADHFI